MNFYPAYYLIDVLGRESALGTLLIGILQILWNTLCLLNLQFLIHPDLVLLHFTFKERYLCAFAVFDCALTGWFDLQFEIGDAFAIFEGAEEVEECGDEGDVDAPVGQILPSECPLGRYLDNHEAEHDKEE